MAWWWLAWRLGRRLARSRVGLGSCICLGCRTRLGLGARLGQSLLVCGGSALRLGANPRLAQRLGTAARCLALLVI